MTNEPRETKSTSTVTPENAKEYGEVKQLIRLEHEVVIDKGACKDCGWDVEDVTDEPLGHLMACART